MSGRSVNLTTLFLGRLRPPKQLTRTSCTYFCQQLTTALLEKAEGETKVCCQTGYRTQDPTYELGALRIALCDPANFVSTVRLNQPLPMNNPLNNWALPLVNNCSLQHDVEGHVAKSNSQRQSKSDSIFASPNDTC